MAVVLSSAVEPGAHFFENNKITGVFTMLKLCMSKERLKRINITCNVERDTTYATKTQQVYLFLHCDYVEIDPLQISGKATM